MEKNHHILSFVKRFLAGTLLSRIFGAVRDVSMAICFGSAPEIGSFMVAYRFSNLFRRLLGEGSLQSGFTPFYSSLDEKKSSLFYRDFSFSLTVFLFFAVFLLELFSFFAMDYLDAQWQEVLSLSMIMMPGVVFICLSALNAALLQAKKSFFSPSVSPVLFNITWIAMGLYAQFHPIGTAVKWLSVGVSLGYFFQWAMTSFHVRQSLRISNQEWFSPQIFSLDVRKVIKPIFLGILGIGASQINSVMDVVFARISDPSGPAYLWFSVRFQQLPIGLFAVALTSALLPTFSAAFAEGNLDRFYHFLQKGISHALAFMIPFTFLIFSVGPYGLNIFYGHGDFPIVGLRETSLCLWGYSCGLVPITIVMILVNCFYAKKSFYIPMIASAVSVVFHLCLNAMFVFIWHFGAFSVALSTSLSSLLNAILLIVFFYKEFGSFPLKGFFNVSLKLVLSSGFASVVAFILAQNVLGHPYVFSCFEERLLLSQGISLFLMAASFLIALVVSLYLWKVDAFFELFHNRKLSDSV